MVALWDGSPVDLILSLVMVLSLTINHQRQHAHWGCRFPGQVLDYIRMSAYLSDQHSRGALFYGTQNAVITPVDVLNTILIFFFRKKSET